MEELKLIKAAEDILREDPRSRTDTKWFVIQVLRKMNIKIFIDYRDLKKLPSFESILRSKRIIQNERNLYNDYEFIKEKGVTFENA